MTVSVETSGFVDLQVNGFGGVDFSSPELTAEDFINACRQVLQRGTAAFLPTVITSPPELYQRNLPLMAEAMAAEEFAGRLLGFHIEGPFLSPLPGAIGAHNPEWIRLPDTDLLDRMQTWAGGKIRMITIAADSPGADDLCRHATDMGIVVSLGHHMATRDDLHRLAAAGAKALTHLGNGLPNKLNRHDNPLWAGLACDELTAMLIADGHHLPAGMLKVMLRAKGVENVVIVSDTSPIAGLPPGRYETLGNLAVLETNGLLHNPDRQCLVGSSATMRDCMNYLASLNLLTGEEIAAVGRVNPLRLLVSVF